MKLDPRTKLFILAITGITVFLNGNLFIECLFALFPFVLLCTAKRLKTAFSYGLLFSALVALQYMIVPLMPAAAGSIVYVFSVYIRKLIPCLMLGNFLIATTQVSRFMASLYKMHIPKGFAVALSITIRYFPTMKEEWTFIKEAMALRGLSASFPAVLRRPIKTMEYIYVPMLVSASKISDEITQAAVTRGIDHVQRRTCIETVRFSVFDVLVLAVYAGIVLLFLRSNGVLPV